MRSTHLAFATALALTAPVAPAAAAVGGFRLPPSADQRAQPAPDRQGPVAPDVPESRRTPTPTPTPAPQATNPAPIPVVTPPPIVAPSPGTTTAGTAPTRAAPAGATARLPAATSSATPEAAGSSADAADLLLPPPSSGVATPASPAAVADATPQADRDAANWPWLLGALVLLAGLGLAALAWRRRQAPAAKAAALEIERPRVAPTPASPASAPAAAAKRSEAPSPAPVTAPGEPLQVALEPLRLSLTLMNAALAYRLEIANRGTAPLSNLAIGADMISAHASMSSEEQLSGPSPRNGAATVQRIERLEPGESRVIEGEFRVPFSQIVPIRQGNAALLLPLARFRVEAEGAPPVVRTFAVGQPGNGSSLQPFRLDQGPRVYPRLTQHAFA